MRPFELDVPSRIYPPTGGGDGSVVVVLHGKGMDPWEFASEVEPCIPPSSARFVTRAPLPYEHRDARGVREGHAWYVYTGEDEGFVRSMVQTEGWLLDGLSQELRIAGPDLTLDPSRMALLGFSQGGYLAGFAGLRRASRFRGLVVAGGRIKHEVLEDAARRAPGFPVLHVHGERDESVRPGPSRESVERVASWGVAAEFRSYPCGHAVLRDPQCQADVRAFLARVVGD